MKNLSHGSGASATGAALFVNPGRRHGISRRMLEGEATPEELVHALLGAGASNTLEGGLVQAHVFAELLAAHLADERHFGTVARQLVATLEVCLVLVEALDLDAQTAEEVKTK